MRLAIMQPYFFPYLGHFDLISRVDTWVVFDTAQYIRRGWMHRNRVYKPPGQQGWQYVSCPVRREGRECLIRDVRLASDPDWRDRLLRQLQHYAGSAPGFNRNLALVQSCLAGTETRLAQLNVSVLQQLCTALDIPFRPVWLSETGADPGPCKSPGARMLAIARNLGATTCVNPAGGAHLLDRAAFEAAGIRLEIQHFENPTFQTGRYAFEPGLSIIDALMWQTPEELRTRLSATQTVGTS